MKTRPWLPVLVALILITVLAAAFRFYAIDRLPPGLHYDEAFNNLMALRLLHGAPRPIYFRQEFGEEPLHIYLIWLLFQMVGLTPLGGRLVSALAGTLTVPLLGFTVREIFYAQVGDRRATRLGLLAALSLAGLYWHVHYSRIGMEPNMVPALAVPAFGFTWRSLRTRRARDAVLGGVFLGGVLYTYPASRFVPLVLPIFFGALSLFKRGFLRDNWRALMIVAVVAFLVFSPLGYFFAKNPFWFTRRAGMVTMGTLPRLRQESANLARAFFNRGDLNPRQNLPGRPIFDPVQAVLFVLGVGACLALRTPPHLFLLCWMGVLLLPSVLTEYSPHFGRMLGAAPAAAALVGVGFSTLYDLAATAAARWLPRARQIVAGGVVFALGVAFTFSGFRAARDYFVVWGRSHDLFIAFDVGLRWAGEYAAALPQDERVFLTPVGRDYPTLLFLVDDRENRVQSFNGRRCFVYCPKPDRPVSYVVIVTPEEDPYSLLKAQAAFPDGRVVAELPIGNRPYAVVYRVPAGSVARTGPAHPLEFRFGNGVRLLGFDPPEGTFQPGSMSRIRLYWQSQDPITQVYKSFVHLWQPPTSLEAGRIWGQEDAQPCDNSYPYSWWIPGDIVAEERWIPISPDIPPGEYQLLVGLYQDNGPRVPVLDGLGHPMGDHAVLTTVQVVTP